MAARAAGATKAGHLRDYRVGVLPSDPQAEVEQPYQDAIAALARWLEGEGAAVEVGAKPDFPTEDAMEVYTMLLRAATSKRMSDEMMAQSREDLDRLPAHAIAYRRRMLEAQTMLHRDWLRWNERRHALMAGWEEWFENFDLLLCPAASSAGLPARPCGRAPRPDHHLSTARTQPVVDQLFWAGYPCGYYLPSTVAPIGLVGGLPVGIQIIGRQYDDLDLPAHGGADRGGLLPLHAAAGVLTPDGGPECGRWRCSCTRTRFFDPVTQDKAVR